MIKKLILALALSLQLTACATAKRGTTTLLVVNTTPPGANVITNIETKQSNKISASARETTLKGGVDDDLKFEYLGCDPTPCGIEVSRKAKFEILVSKDDHVPQLFFIDRIHRKDVAKKNSGNVALATGAAAGAGAAAAVATGATIAGASIAAPLALLAAFPVLTVGGTSIIVDAASGANFDLTPNPVTVNLVTISENTDTQADIDLVSAQFFKRRHDKSLGITSSKPKKKKVKMCNVTHMKRIPCDEYYESRRQK